MDNFGKKLLVSVVVTVAAGFGAASAAENPTPPPPPASHSGPWSAQGVGDGPSSARGAGDARAAPKDLGDLTKDLTFTPLTPCRVFDTRNTGVGAFTGTQNFYVTDDINLTTQGATLASCGVPAGNEPVAVMINITAISTSSFGWTSAFALGSPVPVASILNWTATGSIVPNTTIVPVCQGCGAEISINQPSGAAYVFADVLGYFQRSEATALEQTILTNSASVAIGSTTPQDGFLRTAACAAGYTLTGGGAGFNGNFVNLYLSGSYPETTNWFGAYHSERSSAVTFTTYAICARVPGLLP